MLPAQRDTDNCRYAIWIPHPLIDLPGGYANMIGKETFR